MSGRLLYYYTLYDTTCPKFVEKISADFGTSTLLRAQNTMLLSKVRRMLWPSQKTQTLKLAAIVLILINTSPCYVRSKKSFVGSILLAKIYILHFHNWGHVNAAVHFVQVINLLRQLLVNRQNCSFFLRVNTFSENTATRAIRVAFWICAPSESCQNIDMTEMFAGQNLSMINPD